MRKIVSCIVIAALTVGVAGCGKVGLPSFEKIDIEEASDVQNDRKVTINVVTMMGGADPNNEKYQLVIRHFKEQYPDVVVEDHSEVVDTDWKAKIVADFAVDNEPDILQFFTDANATDLLLTNKFVPLSEIQKEYPEVAKDTSVEALEATRSPLDGINYAVPTAGYWEGLFCNKDLFDKYDIALPTDWNSFVAAIEGFKARRIIPVSVSLNNIPNYWIEHLMLSTSTKEEFERIPQTAPDSWVKGLSLLKDLREMGAFPENTDTIDNEMATTLFRSKKAAMQLEGSWFSTGIRDQKSVVVVPFPGVKQRRWKDGMAISGFSSGFYITKKAWADPDKREAVVNFLLANTNNEQVIDYWGGNGECSVPVDLESIKLTALQRSGFNYSQTITDPINPTDSRITAKAYSALVENAVGISRGRISPKTAINSMLKIQNSE